MKYRELIITEEPLLFRVQAVPQFEAEEDEVNHTCPTIGLALAFAVFTAIEHDVKIVYVPADKYGETVQ